MVTADYVLVSCLNTTRRNPGLTCIPFHYKKHLLKNPMKREGTDEPSRLHVFPTGHQNYPN